MGTPVHDLRLPDSLRGALAQPFGPIVQTHELRAAIGNRSVAAVGDVVALTLHDLGIVPRFFVCDFKTQRGQDDDKFRAVLGSWGDQEARVHNPPAMVSKAAYGAVARAWSAEGITRIVVDGEEDLLGLPAIAEGPLGTCVVYGMPNRGVVVVSVNQEMQENATQILAAMEAVSRP